MCSPYCQPDMESQFQLLPDVCKYLCLSSYSYPYHAIILIVCPLKSMVDSHLRELRKECHFSSQFEQWRRRWEQFVKKNLFLCIRKSRVLLTERLQKEINSVDFNGVFSTLFIARNNLLTSLKRSSDTTLHHPSGNGLLHEQFSGATPLKKISGW